MRKKKVQVEAPEAPPDESMAPVSSTTDKTKAEKLALIKGHIDRINKDYQKQGGEPNARIGGQTKAVFMASELQKLSWSYGIKHLDEFFGGIPRGVPVVWYGPTGVAKSSTCYWQIALLQRQGLVCGLIPVENGFDPVWAQTCGVNLDELVVADQGKTIEETVQNAWELMKLRAIDHWLLDSVHGQLTKKELYKSTGNNEKAKERDIEDENIGSLPQKLGAILRRITPTMGKAGFSLSIIGQARDNIGSYGGGITLTGGHALKHAARTIIRCTRAGKAEWRTRGDEVLGFTSRFQLELQQVNANEGKFLLIPFRTGKGLDIPKLLCDLSISYGGPINQGAGSFWIWKKKDDSEVKINGRPSLYQYFEDQPDELAELSSQMSS